MLHRIFTSPHVADAILLIILVEGVVLVRWRAVPVRIMLSMLLPGMFLLLALRAALADAAWPWVPIVLSGALFAHVFDLWTRFIKT